jgi:hypothetical protein
MPDARRPDAADAGLRSGLRGGGMRRRDAVEFLHTARRRADRETRGPMKITITYCGV